MGEVFKLAIPIYEQERDFLVSDLRGAFDCFFLSKNVHKNWKEEELTTLSKYQDDLNHKHASERGDWKLLIPNYEEL